MALCSKGLHNLEGNNLLLEYGINRIAKRCRACKNAYENKRKRFKRAYPGQPYNSSWQEPKFKRCKKGTHLLTPSNIRLVGKDRDRRCNKCYKIYRRAYRKTWELWKVQRIK